ncbi:hypothetical protein HY417_00440 [Candidatus Kaiserbacteria bacterium]|nr:hypothetical protein [Candidatus Kaiserbacteria bacterium]
MAKRKATIDDVMKVIRPMRTTVDSLVETVEFIKDRMVTKSELRDELRETESRLNDAINVKVGGVDRRLDGELDRRKLLEVRVVKLEAKVK